MSRTAERWLWIGVIVLLLLIGLGAAGMFGMFGMCGRMMGGGMMGQASSAPPMSGGNSQ